MIFTRSQYFCIHLKRLPKRRNRNDLQITLISHIFIDQPKIEDKQIKRLIVYIKVHIKT